MSEEMQKDELTLLKERAKKMNIKVQGNLSVESLKELIANHTNNEVASPKAQLSLTEIKREATKLIRVRIQNMNPNKKNMSGEIFSVGNRAIGTIKKFIPYSPDSHPDGYHVPQALLNQLMSRQFQFFREEKKGSHTIHKPQFAKEFAIEILPQLTEEELKKLSVAQKAKGGLD